jgi:hypothetical protein
MLPFELQPLALEIVLPIKLLHAARDQENDRDRDQYVDLNILSVPVDLNESISGPDEDPGNNK